jgi:hypothetical protein
MFRYALAFLLTLSSAVTLAQDDTRAPPIYSWASATANKPQPSPLALQLPVEILFYRTGMGVDKSDGAIYGPAITAGLFGPFIAIATQSGAAKAAATNRQRANPFIGLFDEFKFNDRIEAALRTKLGSEGISPAPAIAVYRLYPGGISDKSRNEPTERMLTIYPYYSMNANFSELRTKLFVQIVERRLKGNGRISDNDSFNRTYSFAFQIEDEGHDENLRYWSGFQQSELEAMLEEGIAQVTDMIAYDFSPAGRHEWRANTLQKLARLKGRMYRGLPVSETPDWVWVRTGTKLQGFEGYRPIEASTPPGYR